jgi:dephospho-CoA kinase
VIIGICGKKETGKSTVTNYLVQAYGFTEFIFAKALKDMLIRNGLATYEDTYVTKTQHSRWLMQTIGELFRKEVNSNYWVNQVDFQMSKHASDCIEADKKIKMVVSDIRYPNEAELIKERQGYLIKIVRDTGYEDNHPSEANVDLIDCEYIIHNNGSINDLYKRIDRVLQYIDKGYIDID